MALAGVPVYFVLAVSAFGDPVCIRYQWELTSNLLWYVQDRIGYICIIE